MLKYSYWVEFHRAPVRYFSEQMHVLSGLEYDCGINEKHDPGSIIAATSDLPE
jgi:hypothetical protein